MNESRVKTYYFGPFRLETQWQRLFQGETIIPLTRKRYEILLLLIENAGRILHKDEIISKIWQNQIVEESNLTQHIYVLRRLIEDDPRTPQYILTIPGEGYRFHPLVNVTTGTDSTTSNLQPVGETSPYPVIDPPASQPSTLPKHGGIIARVRSLGSGIRLLLAAGLLVFTILIISIFWLIRTRSSDEVSATTPVISPLLTLPGIKGSLTYSPDGKFLAFISDAENANSPDVYVKIASSGDPVRITNSKDGEFYVAWSPDGRELAFLRWSPERSDKYQLIVAPSLGGMERQVAVVEGGLSWSPDGRYFAVTDREQPGGPMGIFLVSVDGQTRKALSELGDRRIYYSNPRFSPDGKQVAFVRWINSGSGELHIVNVGNGETRQLTFDQGKISDLQWSPDGELIFFVSNRNGNQRLWQIPVDGGSPKLVNSVPVDILNFAISPLNEDLAYSQRISDTTSEVYQIGPSNGPAGSASVCTINSSRTDDSPRWSPNGQQIAFVSNRSGFDEIWITHSDCTQPTQITSFKSNEGLGSPRWSPDGRMLVFDQVVQGYNDILRVEVDNGKILRLTADPAEDRLPAFSADGNWLYFTSDRNGNDQIWKMPTDGGSIVQVTLNGGFEPVESPDGKTLYYTRSNYLWQKNLASGEESQVKELVNSPVRRYWHIGSGHIYYTPLNSSGPPSIFKLNLASRVISKVTEIGGYATLFVPGISVTAAEDKLVASYIGHRFSDILVVENWR